MLELGARQLALGAVLTAFVCAAPTGCTRRVDDERLNVVLISVDSLRADHLGAFGYDKETSPTMDGLAREGATFTNAISSTSWTLPAHAALFTGLPDAVHGTGAERALAPEFTTIAEVFSDNGYSTAGFYAGPFLHPVFGLSQGFDEYVDCTSYGLGQVSRPDPRAYHQKAEADVTNPIILEKLRARLDQLSDDPFFFFVHLWDVHYDYIPPTPYDSMFDPDYAGTFTGENFYNNIFFKSGMNRKDYDHVVALYDGEIRFTDDAISQMLTELRSRNLLDNTLVVVTADHGDEFLDHGSKGHRNSLYEELVRIPLIFWLPARIDPIRRDEVVRIIDVAPTILDLAGLAAIDDSVGTTLGSLIHGQGDASSVGRPALSELSGASRSGDLISLRVGNEKIILNHDDGTSSYFDLDKDPGEHNPQPAETTARARRLLDLAAETKRRYAELAPVRKNTSLELEPRVKEQLRSLGYLD